MSFRLACELSGKITAAAPVTATMSEFLMKNCRPSQPVSILIINGEADPLVPYDGGEVNAFGLSKRGKIASTEDSVKYWKKINKCSDAPKSNKIIDSDPDDKTSVKIESFSDEENKHSVILYTIIGGGHTWPQGWQYLPKKLIGLVSQEIDATEEIWNFFKKQRRE
jgi:polyhydroxybutyrate depolymerase